MSKPSIERTTSEVKHGFVNYVPDSPYDRDGDFDRWLAEAKADAWDEGLYAAHKEHNEGTDEPRNPYREGTS